MMLFQMINPETGHSLEELDMNEVREALEKVDELERQGKLSSYHWDVARRKLLERKRVIVEESLTELEIALENLIEVSGEAEGLNVTQMRGSNDERVYMIVIE